MDNFGIWDFTKFICNNICCNRPFDERFDFSNKPTEQLYTCLNNENSVGNLSTSEHFTNGIPSISNNLTIGLTANGNYSTDRTINQNHTGSNHSSPNQPDPIYEYNLAELALLDNQRAEQYIQQQQNRNRQSNTSAKQTTNRAVQKNTDSQFDDNSSVTNVNHHSNGNQLNIEENGQAIECNIEIQPPPLPRARNYFSNLYSAPPQYSEPDFREHSFAYSNPPLYTPSTSNVPIYGRATNSTSVDLENEFNGCATSNLNQNSSTNSKSANKSLTNHHHLPHHPSQNSLLSMDGLRVQLARTKKQMAAVANSATQLNSNHLSPNGQSNAAQNLVANLVPNQIRAPQIQRSAEMQVSLKGWLYRLEGPALKQWRRRWFVLGEYCLFYYKDGQERKMIGSVLLPSYSVSNCTTNGDGITRKFAFKLEHHNLKTHYLAAECAESKNQWMRLISLSATMQLNAANYEQLTDGTISSALNATNISRNRPDSQDIMNIILNGNRTLNNNENNKNFVNTQDLDQEAQFNASSSVNNSSLYNSHQRRDSPNLNNSNHDNLTKLAELNESGSESGFVNYKSRRQSKTNSELETSVSNAYNSVGLPTINTASGGNYAIYSSNGAQKANQMNQQQVYAPKRSHYVNAPPKPRRHQLQANNLNGNSDFDTYSNSNLNAYATNHLSQTANKPPMHPSVIHSNAQPDPVDAKNCYPKHDLYSIPPTHQQDPQRKLRNSSFSTQGEDQQILNENLYIQHHRRTLTRQNASNSGCMTPMDDMVASNNPFYDPNGQIKSRPKSSQEQFDNANQLPQMYNNLHEKECNNQALDQLNSPPYRPWSDFLQQAQRSQSTTPMSAKQNQLPPSGNAFNSTANNNPSAVNSTSALAVSAAMVALGTQSASHAQLNSCVKTNRFDDEHAKQIYSTGHLNALRTDSPDYMNIEFFKQQQLKQQSNEASPSSQLMQKLDINIEQQEKIYQSVLSKNARLEIENLKNEVAKQKQLKKKQQNQNLTENIKQDESKLDNISSDNMDQDIIPPPLNLDARSIKRRDSERSARLAKLEMEMAKKLEDEKNDISTDDVTTDDNSDEINLSPNPFCRSQFRRSFMNAVYTQKPHTNIAASYASHAYCGPIDEPQDDEMDDDNSKRLPFRKSPNKFDENLEHQIMPVQLTMQQRREQLQRLLHSDASLDSDVSNENFGNLNLPQSEEQQIKKKPPRNTFKLTKECFSEVRATPAIIVATPEKAPAYDEEKPNEIVEELNQIKKQLAFDLIQPIAHKPPRGNSKLIVSSDQTIEIASEKMNVRDRIKILEKQNSSDSNLPASSSNNSLNDKEDRLGLRIEPINLTSRLRSSSLCEAKKNSENENSGRQRSLSNQNLNYLGSKNNEENIELGEANQVQNKEAKFVGNDHDEEDNGYLTMESKLSSNNEIDEQSISLSAKTQKQHNSTDDNKQIEILTTENPQNLISINLPENVNFDDIFGAEKEQLSPSTNNISVDEVKEEMNITMQINEPDDSVYPLDSGEQTDHRKTMDDQFAIIGLDTIKKAPKNFKLTSALIAQKTKNEQNQSPQQIPQASSQTKTNQVSEQLNNSNNFQQNQSPPSTSQQADHFQFRTHQIVASSLINRGNNLVFVSNPIMSTEMDANPAYESFDGILYGQQCLTTTSVTNIEESNKTTDEINKNLELPQIKVEIDAEHDGSDSDNCHNFEHLSTPTTSSQSNNAPYYYADLLNEKQQQELINKSNESRPQLSSRSGNTVIGATSLQKLTISENENSPPNDSEEKVDQELSQVEVMPETLNNSTKLDSEFEEFSNSPISADRLNTQQAEQFQRMNYHQNVSSSIGRLYELEMYELNDPVYENVDRLTGNSKGQSSTDLSNNHSFTILENNEQHEYSNDSKILRRISQNYTNQNVKIQQPSTSSSGSEKLNNQNLHSREGAMLNNEHTPNKLNNSIKNALNHKTTPIHLRSPTVTGYATIDSEQSVLLNEDYKMQSPDMNTNDIKNQADVDKLSKKPNLISQSASNLSKMIKSNNLKNYSDHNDQTSLSSSLTSSAQSLGQLSRVDVPIDSRTFNSTDCYRQQSAPNLLMNNLPNNGLNNYHGKNLNNNAEKCLADKQLNLNKNINKINNLLNASANGQDYQDYVVYENADAERTHLLALQKQLQQQEELLYQQQKQLQRLQLQQQMKQIYIRNEFTSSSFQSNQIPTYSSDSSLFNHSSSIINESTIPYDRHLKNLQNVSILQKDSQPANNKNYHNYQNVFQDERS